MDINAETLNQLFGAISVLILAVIAWYNKQRTESAATTAAATTQTATTNAAIADLENHAATTAAIKNYTPTLYTEPTSTIYDPALHGYQGPNMVSWEQMRKWVLFRVDPETRKNLLSGVQSAADQLSILNQIAAAEATNEYQYSITYSSGYYLMTAVCSPVGANQYKYCVVAHSSGGGGAYTPSTPKPAAPVVLDCKTGQPIIEQ